MSKKPDTPTISRPSFDPSIQSEEIAYAATELTECGVCGRQNPPTRSECLYCGHELEIESKNLTKVKPVIRSMESWERGFNIIGKAERDRAQVSIPDIASLISQPIDYTNAILASGKSLPLARVESIKHAERMTARLASLGLICQIISDETLASDQPPVRLSGIEFGGTSLTFIAFLAHERTEILVTDLVLIIPGFLSQNNIDLVETRKRKGSEILDEVESSSHETILDLYSRNDPRGYRIQLAGFDFSCLGEEKGFLATENIKRLVILLTKLAVRSKLVDDYGSIRRSLGHVWEIERRSDTQGMRRLGFGKTGHQKVETTSNIRQFTKYSRLQWHLYEQEGIAEEAKEKTTTTGEKSLTREKTIAP